MIQFDSNFWVGFCSGFGICFGMVVVVAIVVDIAFVRDKITTISGRNLAASQYSPVIAALVGGIFCLIIGTLLGHLYFPQLLPAPAPQEARGHE